LPSALIDLKQVLLNGPVIAACLCVAFLTGVPSAITAALAAVRRPITEALRFVD
jgi:hypothetical protein